MLFVVFDLFDNMSDFLEKTMKKINLMDDEEIEKLKQDFQRVMKLTFDFFGKNNLSYFSGHMKNGNFQPFCRNCRHHPRSTAANNY